MAQKDPLYGFELKKAIARGEVSVVPRAVGAEGEAIYINPKDRRFEKKVPVFRVFFVYLDDVRLKGYNNSRTENTAVSEKSDYFQ